MVAPSATLGATALLAALSPASAWSTPPIPPSHGSGKTSSKTPADWLPHAAATLAVSASLLAPLPPAFAAADLATRSAEEFSSTAGFEDFAAAGGKMQANPSCFFDECKEQTTSCFTNPACLKGITCLGNCRGEQLCATQCFARFGSERLNAWLGCTLEDKECVTTGVKQDTKQFYANPPPAMSEFKPSDLEGKWYKVLGYNPKYDTYPCQTNEFVKGSNGGLTNDILFRVPKPDGSGAWQNNFLETMEDSRGPEGKASMTVEGKMFGLTFHEQWYALGKGDDFRVVAYIGDTQQGPYDGAFVFTTAKDTLKDAKLRAQVDGIVRSAGLDPKQMSEIDNTCPANFDLAGASASESAKEKLEWKDVFELTEWFRPGTIKRDANFNPNAM
jgi:hypothetical protein